MRKIRFLTYTFLLILFSVPFWGAQYVGAGYHVVYLVKDSISQTQNVKDSLPKDSLLSDSVPKKRNALDAIVDYTANDSIVLTADNWGYLYGAAEVKYTDISLKGEKLSMNMDSSIVHATFGLDSVGKEFGYPVFADKSSELEAKTMKYNFKNRKGYSTNLITTQGEGYIIASKAKKNEDNSYFTEDAIYTTCDDHEHPHFYLALTKGKVKPGKNVVAGPSYLVIEGLPLPIGLPFGFFPFSKKYSSGVIMPSYGDELDRGFNLRDGGYYFAINDNIDLALTGEIYTKGSWGLNARSSYRKRYKYSGSFDLGYMVTKLGEKGIDYSVSKDLKINWSHSQDPKANQFRTLSASVNFTTSSYDRNNLNTAYTPAGTQNVKGSTVNLTQRIPNSPWSFSTSMSVNQRTQDASVSMTLPSMTITMSRVAPFKRKEAVGSEKWYEKIQISYTGDLRNSIDTKEDQLLKSNLGKDWKNGMQHSIPISATFNVLNHLNITPSVNYRERWYTTKISKKIDENGTFVTADTTGTFSRVYDFNASLNFQTKLYGFFQPVFYNKAEIRHVFTPSISFSYAPDFGADRWGYYKTENYFNRQTGEWEQYTYSPYEQGMFGVPGRGAQGVINFQFDNNVEMKLKTANDSVKKISLIDNLGIGFSYNMQAEEFKWSDINTSIRLKLSKTFTINLNAVFDPYLYEGVYSDTELDEKGERKLTGARRIDNLRIGNGRGIGRLRSTGYSISPSINQDTFKKWFGGDKDSKRGDGENPPQGEGLGGEGEEGGSAERQSLFAGKKDDNQYDDDGYIKNEIKWSLGFNFSMNYSYNQSRTPKVVDKEKNFVEYRGQLTKNFGFNGNIQPTKNWSLNFNATYDFDMKKIAYLTCNITRNLHCWSLSASFNPVGQYKSYYVSLRASSSMLQDLKYENRGRSSSYDPNWD